MTTPTRIVLTRQAEANGPWSARLREAGHEVLELPLLRYDAVAPPENLDPGAYDWVLFTSPQGVRAFADVWVDAGHAQLAALGSGTAAALAEAGLEDALGLDTRDGAELAREFCDRVAAPAKVLLPGPRKRLAEPRTTLQAAGFTVTELPLYATGRVAPGDLPAAAFTDADIVFFCSPSAVAAFVAAWHDRPAAVVIGETTATAARGVGFDPRVASRPNLEAMVCAAGIDPLADCPEDD